jgi:nitrite reductase/ring-hydroxylating ferredoxin subunit
MTTGRLDTPERAATGVERRRAALRLLAAAAGAALLAAWGSLSRHRRRRERPERLTLPVPSAEGVTFHGEVILVQDGTGLLALDARCPHLGCTISRHDAGELVCPCHGSRFALSGVRRSGPAPSDLRRLTVRRAKEPDQVDVELPG